MSALGETFRAARESQGLTLSDVAERIHIRSVYLAAIEAEDWRAIGPPVYARGFVRTYARFLGLDADAVSARLSGGSPGSTAPAPLPAAPKLAPRPAEPVRAGSSRGDERKPGLSAVAITGIIVAFALVLFVGYQYVEFARGDRVAVPVSGPTTATDNPAGAGQAPTTAPRRASSDASSAPDAPELHPPAKNDLSSSGFALRLRDGSWLRVVVDGKVAMEGTYPKGTERTFSGRSATVRAGNAGGVELSVDGKDLGPMGGLGDVAERSFQL